MCTVSNTICILWICFKQKVIIIFCLLSVERLRKFKDSHNGMDLENLMKVCVCVYCFIWSGLGSVAGCCNFEFPYNVCNCILSGGGVSNLEMEAVPGC